MAGGLDFNGASSGGGNSRPRYDLDKLADALAATAESWAPALFPRGRISDDRSELRLANIKGAPPRNTGSCVVSLRGERAGSFFDYDPRGGGQSGGPLATLKEATGLSGRALFDKAAELANYRHDESQPRWRAPPKVTDTAPEVAHIIARSRPAPGSLVETYLASRKLPCPASADLLFCDNVSDFKNGVGRPAMIARVRGADGLPTGGIHRTFLAYDGSGKATVDKPKRMLGPIQHGACRLAPVGPDGVLGVSEGLETAIAAMTISGLPVWACLGANNLGGYDKEGAWTGFELPQDAPIKHLVIFADRGPAGEAAAAYLRDVAVKAGVTAEIRLPASADDFNGDLLGAPRHNENTPETIVSRVTLAAETTAAPAQPPPRPEPAIIHPEPHITTPTTGAEEVTRAIGALTAHSSHEEITLTLKMIMQAAPNVIALRQMLNSVKDRTKVPTRALESVLRDLRRDAPPPAPPPSDRAVSSDWMAQVILNEAGEPKPLLENAAVALENAPEIRDVIWLDEFSERIMLRKPPPWHPSGASFEDRPWTDNDDYMATRWLQRIGIHVQTPTTHEAVLSAGFQNPYHPVREYLDGLQWDGTERLNYWLSDYLGVDETPYSHAVGARWMISAVARIRVPGIKVDHMLILEGPQERGKSTALRALFDPWFSDGMSEMGSKDAAIELAGVWLIEFAELDAMRRAERNRLKAFITRATDRYRPPWGRHAIDHPRQMVFAGSVNDETYLDDPTGARRFWPVKIGAIDIDLLWKNRDQLWAEACARFAKGEKFYLHEADLRKSANDEQSMRQIEDAWHARIRRVVDGTEDGTFPMHSASIDGVLSDLRIPMDRWDRVAQNRVIAYFTTHKWERRVAEGETYYYRPRPEE